MSTDTFDFMGWATAYVHAAGPGECSIDLVDEAPGNSTDMETLTFSLPADSGTGAGWDACVIEAATAELGDCGYVLVSWEGTAGSFIGKVGITDWKMEELWEELYSE